MPLRGYTKSIVDKNGNEKEHKYLINLHSCIANYLCSGNI